MCEKSLTAQERVLELVGEDVWVKLSEATQTTMLQEELRLLDIEHESTQQNTQHQRD